MSWNPAGQAHAPPLSVPPSQIMDSLGFGMTMGFGVTMGWGVTMGLGATIALATHWPLT